MTGRVNDSAGVVAEYRPIEQLRAGDEIVGGWRPWAVVSRVERDGEAYRVFYETHGPTAWFWRGELFPVAMSVTNATWLTERRGS